MRLATTLGNAIPALLLMTLPAGARADGPGDSRGVDRDGNPYAAQPVPPANPRGTPYSPATVQVFTDRAAFLAAAGAVVQETFEDDASTALCDGGALPVLAFDDFTATSDPAALKLLREPCFGNANTTPGGQKYLGADTDVGGVSADVMFVFGNFLTALGMDLIDLDAADLDVSAAGGMWTVPANGDGGVSFFGIVSSAPFNLMSFRVVAGVDAHYSFDDLAYAAGGPVDVEASTFGRTKAGYR